MITNTINKYIVRTALSQTEILETLGRGSCIKAEDSFEFVSNMQAAPQLDPASQQPVGVRFSKQTIAYRIDAMLLDAPIYYSLTGTSLYFLDDLKQADADSYKDIIRSALKMSNDMRMQRLQENSGVEPAMPGAIPPITRPRGR